MKLLISTPVFGGNIPIQFLHGWNDTIPYLHAAKVEFAMYNEARNLLSQCRNRAAEYALKNGFDKLLFIDADISWKGIDVMRLLASDRKIVGGTYPFKTFPIRLNFVPPLDCTLGQSFDVQKYIDDTADENGEIEVYRLPTGFLLIDCSVFRDIEPHVETYSHRDPMTREIEIEHMFFPVKKGEDGSLHTEDWGFCDEAQKRGHKIYWQSKCIVDHVGQHTYSAIVPKEESYKKINVNEVDPQAGPNTYDNPFLKWPVNLSCFCGSGRKFKKCHMDNIPKLVNRHNHNVLTESYEKQFAHVNAIHVRGNIYKLDQPLI